MGDLATLIMLPMSTNPEPVVSSTWWDGIAETATTTLVTAVVTALVTAVGAVLALRFTLNTEARKTKTEALITKRVEVYDMIAKQASILLCYFTQVGDYASHAPQDMVGAKRELDASWGIYRSLFSPDSQSAYDAFVELYFETWTGPGEQAKLRVDPEKLRSKWAAGAWDPAWDAQFSITPVTDQPDGRAWEQFQSAYDTLLRELARDLGV